MGNTNQELSQRIDSLSRKLEKFEQSNTPTRGRYTGETWYDTVNKELKIWNGKEFAPIGGTGIKTFQEKNDSWSGVYSGGDFTITCGFKPKAIHILATEDDEGVSVGYASIDEDGNITNGCHYRDGDYSSKWVTDGNKIVHIKRSISTKAYVKNISDTGFVLNVDNNNYRFDTIIMVIG